MTNVTIAVPNDLKTRLDGRPEINWSEVARKAWKDKLAKLDLLDQLTANVKVSDEFIGEISEKIKEGVARAHDKRIKELKGA